MTPSSNLATQAALSLLIATRFLEVSLSLPPVLVLHSLYSSLTFSLLHCFPVYLHCTHSLPFSAPSLCFQSSLSLFYHTPDHDFHHCHCHRRHLCLPDPLPRSPLRYGKSNPPLSFLPTGALILPQQWLRYLVTITKTLAFAHTKSQLLFYDDPCALCSPRMVL